MKTIIGDLWDQSGWIIIPCNLSTNKMGEAIMGRGVAAQAANKYPGLMTRYGRVLKWNNANKVMMEATNRLICLPVKRNWRDKADMSLIANSLRIVVSLLFKDDRVFMPLIGCGFGELDSEVVMPILEALDDRFTLVLRGDEVQKKYTQSFRASLRRDKSLD